MGDPKFSKKKYKRPRIRWNYENIQIEKKILKKNGLKNKKEILIAEKKLNDMKKRIIFLSDREKEKEVFISKIKKGGFISKEKKIENIQEILNLEISDYLARRLQNVVFTKKIANTIKQSRQMITHRKIIVGDRIISKPGYMVSQEEENKIKKK